MLHGYFEWNKLMAKLKIRPLRPLRPVCSLSSHPVNLRPTAFARLRKTGERALAADVGSEFRLQAAAHSQTG